MYKKGGLIQVNSPDSSNLVGENGVRRKAKKIIMTVDKTIKTKIILFALCLAGIILCLYLTSLFLRNNFYDDGEAYHKGAGHLLQENFWKGFAFISLRHLLTSTLIFTLIFIFVGPSSRRLTFKIFAIISTAVIILVLTYAFIKYCETRDFHRTVDVIHFFNRTMEIILTWTYRVLGFLLGYLITKRKKTTAILTE